VYFTDPRYVGDEPRELDFEGVFCIDPKGDVTLATREVEKPNGICVSIDGKTVYVADSNSNPLGNHQLVAFRAEQPGKLDRKRVLFDFGPRRRGIDGMTRDGKGNLYATAGSGAEAGVYVFDPEGKPLAYLATPGDPTNCAFGVDGAASTLYVTAAGPQDAQGARKFGLYRIKLATEGPGTTPAR
jgi:gluconolactonase